MYAYIRTTYTFLQLSCLLFMYVTESLCMYMYVYVCICMAVPDSMKYVQKLYCSILIITPYS